MITISYDCRAFYFFPAVLGGLMKLILTPQILALFTILVLSPFANAFYSTFDTADSIGQGRYKLGAELQYIANNLSGGNLIAHFDAGLDAENSLRFQIGSGSVNFQVGGFYKWAPIPDTSGQPAIAGLFGLVYANQNGRGLTGLRFHPIISKKFGNVTPYFSLPLGITFGSGSTTSPVQLVLGADWSPEFMGKLTIMGEIGAEVSNSFSYLSVGATHPF